MKSWPPGLLAVSRPHGAGWGAEGPAEPLVPRLIWRGPLAVALGQMATPTDLLQAGCCPNPCQQMWVTREESRGGQATRKPPHPSGVLTSASRRTDDLNTPVPGALDPSSYSKPLLQT